MTDISQNFVLLEEAFVQSAQKERLAKAWELGRERQEL